MHFHCFLSSNITHYNNTHDCTVLFFHRPITSEAAPNVPTPHTRPPPSTTSVDIPGMITAEQTTMLRNLDRRVQSLEYQMKTVQQAVLKQASSSGGSNRQNTGSRVWNALTFAGWLMVPLVVVFMFHYHKTTH